MCFFWNKDFRCLSGACRATDGERKKAGRVVHEQSDVCTCYQSKHDVILWAVRPLSPSMIHEEEISWADLWPLGSYSKSAFGVIYDYLKSHGAALHRGPTLIGKREPIHKLNSLIISVKVMLGHWAMTFNAWWLVHGRGMDLPLISRALFPGSGQVQWVSWLSQRY